MFAMPAVQPLTAEKFIELPVPDHGRPWNLIDGEIVVNQPTSRHAKVQTRLIGALWTWTEGDAGRGEVSVPLDVRIDERSVFAPDVLWWAEGRAPSRHAPPPAPLPDIVAEIRSPSTWRYDIGPKKNGYERRGLPELWLVDTAADAILVFRRSDPKAETFDVALELAGEDVLSSAQLPGFRLALRALFA